MLSGIQLSKYNKDLSLINLGPCTKESAIAALKEIISHADTKFESGEEALMKTSFIISRSDSDFINVSANGKNTFHIQTDRIATRPSFWKRLFSRDQYIELTEAKTKLAIEDYFSMERNTFECKYLD